MARARLRAQSAPPQTQKHTYLLCCGVISIQLFLLPPAYLSFSLFLSLASKLNPLAPFNTKIGATPQLLRLGRERRGGKISQNHRRSCGGGVTAPSLVPERRRRCRLCATGREKKPGGPPESVRYSRERRPHTIWSRRLRCCCCCWLYRRLPLDDGTICPLPEDTRLPVYLMLRSRRTHATSLALRQTKTFFSNPLFPSVPSKFELVLGVRNTRHASPRWTL